MLEGGRLLGQGRYGCTFDTVPACRGRARTVRNGRYIKDRAQTRRVAKVLAADDPSVPVEIAISKQLRSLPNYKDYFVLVDESCEGDDITGDPDWMDCRLFAPERRRIATFVQLRMINGGTKLSDYVRNINATLEIWLDIQIHVFEGIRLLHKRHWVHGDLHMGNILVDDQGVARIVDFGLSYNLDRLKEKNLISLSFLPKFDNYPPEMDLLAGIVNKMEKQQAIEIIYTEKGILRTIEEIFPSRYSVIEDMANFAQRFEIEGPADTKRFIQSFGRATDIWTMGYNLLNIYLIMISTPVVIQSDFYRRHHREQMDLLKGLLYVDPRRRLTAEEALTQLYSMRMD